MIFNLFNKKNKWQHKDKNIRIEGINDALKLDDEAHSAILMRLLNEDESDLVRRAVLLKLHNIDTYIHASVENSQDSIKQFAKKKALAMLVSESEISIQAKQKLISANSIDDTSMLEQWLTDEKNSDLICALYEKISLKKTNNSFLINVFTTKQNEQVQRYLLKDISDTNLLIKLNKKSVNKAVSTVIDQKINDNKLAIEKPIKLEKQLQLVLSKLLALKDLHDYGLYIDRKQLLISSWETEIPNHVCLSKDKQTVLLEKFSNINAQLEHTFSSKEAAYQEEQAHKALVDKKEQTAEAFNDVVIKFKQQLSDAITKNIAIDTNMAAEIESVKNDVIAAASTGTLDENQQQKLLNELSPLLEKLTKLPEILSAISEATLFLAEVLTPVSEQVLPKTLSEYEEAISKFSQWKRTWQGIEASAFGELPRELKTQFNDFKNDWNQALKPFERQQKECLLVVKKKLQDIKRLLLNGKFKVCFGLFKGVKQDITTLTEHQLSQVQRDFEFVSQKMAEVSDWEQYIATPKKQSLLVEMQTLVKSPLDNPNEQASKVKAYRKSWNALGHAEASLDKTLNDEFNNACEAAFAPCRLFYAEQDKLRANNLVIRQQLITEMQQLAKPFIAVSSDSDNETSIEERDEKLESDDTKNIDFKALDNAVNQLAKQWQSAGEVDKTQYQLLHDQFKQSQKLVKEVITNFYQNNSKLKQQLISKAEQLLAADALQKAIDGSKKLQQNWREIGYAGINDENKLWQAFRLVNDQIFAERDKANVKQQAESTAIAKQFSDKYEQIKNMLNENDSEADSESNKHNLLKTSIEALENLLTEVYATKPVVKQISSEIEKQIKALKQEQAESTILLERLSWQNVFHLLAQSADEKNTLDVEQDQKFTMLSPAWKKRLLVQHKNNQEVVGDARLDQTLAIEILAQVDSPSENATQRMAVQVKLMQAQMVSGSHVNLENELMTWLALGKITQKDLPLLERLEKIYIL